jgi:hypothetical protein
MHKWVFNDFPTLLMLGKALTQFFETSSNRSKFWRLFDAEFETAARLSPETFYESVRQRLLGVMSGELPIWVCIESIGMAFDLGMNGEGDERVKRQESIGMTRSRRPSDEVKAPAMRDIRDFEWLVSRGKPSSYPLPPPDKSGFALFSDKFRDDGQLYSVGAPAMGADMVVSRVDDQGCHSGRADDRTIVDRKGARAHGLVILEFLIPRRSSRTGGPGYCHWIPRHLHFP